MMRLSDKHILLLATGFGSGKAPFSPGTFGSAAALPFCALIWLSGLAFGTPFSFLLVTALVIISVVVAEEAVKLLGEKDPSCVVIDEFAGMFVTFAGVTLTWKVALAGFLLFRFFDILKPVPVRTLEKVLPGGAGVVMDDVAAGIMAGLVLQIGIRVLG
ncbi:phosphatidylglycerophosphatase A family protein [Desulfoluna spongiiphila]|uniref:Phosphatidylglycerophosphatase A n=1 Tax=Desulfoluna spongiiphila TaxID=419481 RepID=A0A1G5G1Q4_9BACT|nr:phosphatidylglycerophosphatase A [Desulfoluna spongiiphila]SCY45466.1 phosphatidylglycerophosphatase A [Desulfoluna spongiiphila]